MIKKARKANKGAMHGFRVVDLDFHLVTFAGELPLGCPQVSLEVVIACLPLKREVEVFGVTGGGVEKAQRRAPVKGKGDHGPPALENTEDASLQIFADVVASL
ncbi:MAG: hypothetical protein L6433_10655 [Actinomycetia bacterium]|nr:hypothetical protein [Actinomycetes bacterium]